MHSPWPAGNSQDWKEQGQINTCKQGRLTPVRLAHPTSENWTRRPKMLSQSGEESCNCIIFLDEQRQRFRLWVSPEPVNALRWSLGHCAIRSDDFHNRQLSRIQTEIHLLKKGELLLYFSVRARTHCQYFGQLPAAKLLLMSRTLSTFVWELPGWVNKTSCTLISINISQKEKARNKSDLLESPCEHYSHLLTARFMLPPLNHTSSLLPKIPVISWGGKKMCSSLPTYNFCMTRYTPKGSAFKSRK